MRMKDEGKKKTIVEYIDSYFDNYNESPSLREISKGTGIAITTIHRYLQELNACGRLSYLGRKSIYTDRMNKEQVLHSMPVLGYVTCGAGQEESEQIIEYIRLPESLIGKGNFFVLIAKGESMIEAGIYPGDYVVVNKDRSPKEGDIVVALFDGKNNLKVLRVDRENREYILESCNPDKENYADIRVKSLDVQGVAVSVIHALKRFL